MRRIFLFVSLLLLFSLVVATGASAGSALDLIIKKGKSVVGTTGTLPFLFQARL